MTKEERTETRELRMSGILYMEMKDGETKDEAIARFQDILDRNNIAESVADYSEESY